jgi:hypothetical protein
MTIGPDRLSKAETVTVAVIAAGAPMLVEARDLIAAFHAMVRKRSPADLNPWLERAKASLVASFASGVVKDEAAVRAALTLPWSNGQTEGQITKLKLVKRQMYGLGKLDLLQARVIGAACSLASSKIASEPFFHAGSDRSGCSRVRSREAQNSAAGVSVTFEGNHSRADL